jgi:hypothetical protein
MLTYLLKTFKRTTTTNCVKIMMSDKAIKEPEFLKNIYIYIYGMASCGTPFAKVVGS